MQIIRDNFQELDDKEENDDHKREEAHNAATEIKEETHVENVNAMKYCDVDHPRKNILNAIVLIVTRNCLTKLTLTNTLNAPITMNVD